MMLIDCHAHVFLNPLVGFPKGEGRFASAEEQLAMMDAMGVDQAVILPLTNAETAAEPQSAHEILAICAAHPGRFIPFCCPDPRAFGQVEHDAGEKFEALFCQYVRLGFRGVGELTARVPWGAPCMSGFLTGCQRFRLPVIFHTVTPDGGGYGVLDEMGLPGLTAALAAFPRVPFVGHSPAFWSEIGAAPAPSEKNGYPTGPIRAEGVLPKLLRAYPNLFCDMSAGSGLNALRRDPVFGAAFLREFSGRILFGLDACRAGARPGHAAFLAEQRDAGVLTGAAYDAIASGNLLRLIAGVEAALHALPVDAEGMPA